MFKLLTKYRLAHNHRGPQIFLCKYCFISTRAVLEFLFYKYFGYIIIHVPYYLFSTQLQLGDSDQGSLISQNFLSSSWFIYWRALGPFFIIFQIVINIINFHILTENGYAWLTLKVTNKMFQQFWGPGPFFQKFLNCHKHHKVQYRYFDSKCVHRTLKNTNKTCFNNFGGPWALFRKISNFHKYHKIQYFGSKWVARTLKVINKTFFNNLGAMGPFFKKNSKCHKHDKIQ